MNWRASLACVQDAVGFDASRGDSVSVINMPFSAERGEVIADIRRSTPSRGSGTSSSKCWVCCSSWCWCSAYCVRCSTTSPAAARSKQLAGIGGSDVELGGMGGLDGELANDRVSLGGPTSILLPSPSEGYDAQLNAIKSLVAEDPGRVAQVVKEWINADE